jgi:hypothetical protein
MMAGLLTHEEEEALKALSNAWDKFLELPKLHQVDDHEFMHAIHAAQNIILSRPYLRSISQNEVQTQKES